jgi:hypothetical protein
VLGSTRVRLSANGSYAVDLLSLASLLKSFLKFPHTIAFVAGPSHLAPGKRYINFPLLELGGKSFRELWEHQMYRHHLSSDDEGGASLARGLHVACALHFL